MLAWLHQDFQNSHDAAGIVHNDVCQVAGVGECMRIQAQPVPSVIAAVHAKSFSEQPASSPSCGPSSRSKGRATGKTGDTDTAGDH